VEAEGVWVRFVALANRIGYDGQWIGVVMDMVTRAHGKYLLKSTL
jgi:hypothetical protein